MSERLLPRGWRMAQLGEICDIVNGATPKSGASEYWDGSICWITPTDLGQLAGAEILSSARNITKKGYESCSTTLVPVGAVVMSSRAPIGHLGVASVPLCTNQGCKSFVPTDAVESKFLYHALRYALDDIRALGSGSTFLEVGKKKLAAFSIPLPPLGEQSRVAAWLDRQAAVLGRARAAARAQIDAITALPQALFSAEYPGASSKRLPGGWRWAQLGEIVEEDRIGIHVDDPAYAELPYLGLEHIEASTGKVLLSERDAKNASSKSNNFRFTTEHVLYGKLRPYLNKVALPEFSGRCTTEIVPLKPVFVDRRWLAHLLRRQEVVDHAMRGKTGSRMPRTSMQDLMTLRVAIPPPPEQHLIVNRLEGQIQIANRILSTVQAQARAMNQLLQIVVQRAFAP